MSLLSVIFSQSHPFSPFYLSSVESISPQFYRSSVNSVSSQSTPPPQSYLSLSPFLLSRFYLFSPEILTCYNWLDSLMPFMSKHLPKLHNFHWGKASRNPGILCSSHVFHHTATHTSELIMCSYTVSPLHIPCVASRAKPLSVTFIYPVLQDWARPPAHCPCCTTGLYLIKLCNLSFSLHHFISYLSSICGEPLVLKEEFKAMRVLAVEHHPLLSDLTFIATAYLYHITELLLAFNNIT